MGFTARVDAGHLWKPFHEILIFKVWFYNLYGYKHPSKANQVTLVVPTTAPISPNELILPRQESHGGIVGHVSLWL
jgi:hypothetical protein